MKHALTPVAMLIFSSMALFAMSAPHPESDFVAAVFPPWWTTARAMEAAGNAGEIVAVSALPFVVVIAATTENYSQALNRAGAWFSIRSSSMSFCGTPFREFRSP